MFLLLLLLFLSRNVYCLTRVTNGTGVISRRMEALREVDVYAVIPECYSPRALSLPRTTDTVTQTT